jgi:hypothetical protein
MIDIGQARREVGNMTYVVCLASTGLGTSTPTDHPEPSRTLWLAV